MFIVIAVELFLLCHVAYSAWPRKLPASTRPAQLLKLGPPILLLIMQSIIVTRGVRDAATIVCRGEQCAHWWVETEHLHPCGRLRHLIAVAAARKHLHSPGSLKRARECQKGLARTEWSIVPPSCDIPCTRPVTQPGAEIVPLVPGTHPSRKAQLATSSSPPSLLLSTPLPQSPPASEAFAWRFSFLLYLLFAIEILTQLCGIFPSP